MIKIREKQPKTVTGRKCVLKYPLEKTCFQVQSPDSKKKCFKIPFLTMTSEHPDAVTVKNCVLKYTLETCVLVMIFQIQSPFYFILFYAVTVFFYSQKTVTEN